MGLDFYRAKSIFAKRYPKLRKAMDRNNKAWQAIENAGIGKVTKEMVDERIKSEKELNRQWELFKSAVGWAIF